MSNIGAEAAALVALKPGSPAKSRLSSVGHTLRRELAWAMAADTLIALRTAFERVLVVGTVRAGELDRLGLDVDVVPDPASSGLNAALGHGDELLRAAGVQVVLACVADLPALTATAVRSVYRAAEPFPRSFVADASGLGTTMLIARRTPLSPCFEGLSAAAHAASGARSLSSIEVPEARVDVDTEADLAAVLQVGVGRVTAEVLARAGRRPPPR